MSEPNSVDTDRQDESARPGEPDRELWQLWRQGQRPDVRQFLAAAGTLSLAQVAAVLAVDQRERWQSGERIPAEVYLEQYPPLGTDVEKALELVYGEFLLREELGEAPALEEYLERFPRYAARLRQQWDLHRALAAGSSQLDQPGAPTSEEETILPAPRASSPAGGAADHASQDTPPEAHIPSSPQESRPNVATASTRAEQPEKVRLLPLSGPAERYTLTRLHAQGGLGQVWLARDGALGREIALKELRPDRSGHAPLRARFLEEATITGQLEHPGIVPVYEVAQHPGSHLPFYTMRFIRGRTLSEASQTYHQKRQTGRAGTLDQVALLNAFVAVCNAVAYAHARGVIHRDLKGRNVVLGDFGEVIVLDWGLAKVKGETATEPDEKGEHAPGTLPPVRLLADGYRDDTAPGQVLGTPGYMAPEQAAGRLEEIDERTDVYGLGALLYETLAGQAPFTGKDLEEILLKARNSPPVPPREIVATTPRALEAICLKALAKEPADRYPSAALLAKDVQKYLADEPVAAYAEPLPARLGRWARRHRTLVTSTVATLLVAVVSLTLATTLLSAANQKLIAANERERNAKLAADSNYRLARDAVDQYLVKVSKDRRLYAAGLRELRKDLLEQAGRFYTRFINERGQEPGLEAELGHAFFELAVVRGETSAVPEAIGLFQKGLDIIQPIVQSHPGDINYQKELVSGYHRLATVYLAAGKTAEAESAFQQASALLRKLMEAEPGERGYTLQWASIRHNVALLADKRGEIADAEKLLLDVVGELGQAVQADPGAADLRLGLANSMNSLAALFQSRTGNLSEAQRYYESALGHYQELLKNDPQERDSLESLARTYVNLGILNWYRGKRTDAIQATQQGVQKAQGLAEHHRDVPEYQCDLASYLTTLATLYQETDRLDQAEEAHRRGLAVVKQVAEAHPEIPEYRSRLAFAHRQLGACCLKRNQLAEADRALAQALELDQGLAKAHPDVLRHQLDLGTDNRFLGEVKSTAGDLEGGLRCYGQAVECLQGILKKLPQYADAKRELQMTYEFQARAFSRLGRNGDALQAWDRALAFPEGGRDDICHAGRAVTLARMHQPEPATAEIETLLKKDGSAVNFYNAACVFALSGATPGLDAKRRDHYAIRAMEFLRTAVEKGYPNLEEMKNDKDFDSLRERADFKQLFAGPEKKSPTTPKPDN